jgi:hypothetical protein
MPLDLVKLRGAARGSSVPPARADQPRLIQVTTGQVARSELCRGARVAQEPRPPNAPGAVYGNRSRRDGWRISVDALQSHTCPPPHRSWRAMVGEHRSPRCGILH